MQLSEGWIIYFIISYVFLSIITFTNLLYLYRWYKHDAISWNNIPASTRYFLFANLLVNVLLIFYTINAHGLFDIFTLPEPYGKYFFGEFVDFVANIILLGFLSYVSRILHTSMYTDFSFEDELSMKANIWLTILKIYGFIVEKIVVPSLVVFLFISFDLNSFFYFQYAFFISGIVLFISGISYLSFIIFAYFSTVELSAPIKKMTVLKKSSADNFETSPTNSDFTSILIVNDHTSLYAPLPSWAVIPEASIVSPPCIERFQKNSRVSQNQKIIYAWVGIILTFVTTAICFYKGFEARGYSGNEDTIEYRFQANPNDYSIGMDLFSYIRNGFIIIAQHILPVPPATLSCK